MSNKQSQNDFKNSPFEKSNDILKRWWPVIFASAFIIYILTGGISLCNNLNEDDATTQKKLNSTESKTSSLYENNKQDIQPLFQWQR